MQVRDVANNNTCDGKISNPIYPLQGVKREWVNLGLSLGGQSGTLVYDSAKSPWGYDGANGPSLPPGSLGVQPGETSAWGDLGKLWWSSLHRRLVLSANGQNIQALRGQGAAKTFNGSGLSPMADVSDSLTREAGAYRYRDQSNLTLEDYDLTTGLLKTWASASGMGLTAVNSMAAVPGVAPGAGYLLSLTDPFGRSVSFTYTTLGTGDVVINKITDAAGKFVTPGYDAAGNLSSLTWQDGSVRTFKYDSPNANQGWAFTGVVDESNKRFSTFKYDPSGWVKSSEHAGGVEKVETTYATPPKPTIREVVDLAAQVVWRYHEWQLPQGISVSGPNGQNVTWTATAVMGASGQTSQGAPRVAGVSQPAGAGCGASSSKTEYDSASGNVLSRDDFNGKRVCYLYNEQNQERARYEGLLGSSAGGAGTSCSSVLSSSSSSGLPAEARKISTLWHPDWKLEVRRAEPHKLTTWVYNGQPDPLNGNAISSCAPTTALLPDGKPIAVLCKQVEQATLDANGWNGFAAPLVGLARVRAYTYNSWGKVLTTSGPRTDVTDTVTHEYWPDDAICPGASEGTGMDKGCRGELKSTTNALGHVTQFLKYNAHGQLLESQDPNGALTRYTYDLRQRMTSRSVGAAGDAAPATTTLEYWPTGLLKQVTLPDGQWTHYTYDGAHRLTDITDRAGNKTHHTLDNAGNITKEVTTNPDGSIARNVTRVFDALGRLQDEIDGSQPARSFGYHANGELKFSKTPKQDQTDYSIDALGRLIKVIDPLNGITKPTTFEHDGQDQLKRVQAPNGAVTSYDTDGLGNVKSEASADRGSLNATYDQAGNLKTQTDARGITHTHQYDALNRLIQASTTGGSQGTQTITYTWDSGPSCTHGIGRLCRISDPAGTTQYAYDVRGNLSQQTRTEAGQTFTTLYAYTAADLVQHTLTPTGETSMAQRNQAGQIQQLDVSPSSQSTAPATTVASQTQHNALGQISSETLGQALLSRDFDDGGRLESSSVTQQVASSQDGDAPLPAWALGLLGAGLWAIKARLAQQARSGRLNTFLGLLALATLSAALLHAQPALAQGATHTGLTLEFDENGNVKRKNTPQGSTTFEYDKLDRLKSESGPAANQAFTLDANGNRTALSGPTGPIPASQAITYHSGTNRIATINGVPVTIDAAGYLLADNTHRYTWDDWGNLKELRKLDGALLATYHYDHRHLRTRKVTTAAAPQGAGTTLYHHDQSGHLIGESSANGQALVTYLWRDGLLTGVITHQPTRQVYTVEVDHLGSPWQVRTLPGQVVWRWNSAAYGDTAPNEDPDGDGQKFTFNLRFPGQYFDAESGLHYNWHRYYSPRLGRYLQSDPIGLQGGLNTYAYAGNQPTLNIDPDGRFFFVAAFGWGALTATADAAVAAGTSWWLSRRIGPSWPTYPPDDPPGGRSCPPNGSGNSCYEQCKHLLPSPSGDLQASEFRACYRRCMGSLK